jgi:hypothetical protein
LTKSENIFNRNYCQIFVDCPLVQQYDEPTLKECQKRPITVSKDTYYSVKRHLLQCQKRPITVSKETYYSVKRDLLQCQKRPITVSKETYNSVKRHLLQTWKEGHEVD